MVTTLELTIKVKVQSKRTLTQKDLDTISSELDYNVSYIDFNNSIEIVDTEVVGLD